MAKWTRLEPVDGYSTPVFHLTPTSNLRSIVENDGLLSSHELTRRGVVPTDNAGNPSIKRDRDTRVVPYLGAPLGAFVPFYFLTRNAALYVMGRKLGGSCVLLVAKAQSFAAERIAFCDRHPFATGARWSNEMGDVPAAMESATRLDQSWLDQDQRGAKQKWMAEFLVYERVPLNGIVSICVRNYDTRDAVEAAMRVSVWPDQPPIQIVAEIFE